MRRYIWIIASIIVVAGILAVSTITYRSSATLPMVGRSMMPNRYGYTNYFFVALGNAVRNYNLTDRLNPTLVAEYIYDQSNIRSIGPISDIWLNSGWNGYCISGKFLNTSNNNYYHTVFGNATNTSCSFWDWGSNANYLPNGFEVTGRTTSGNLYGMASWQYRTGQTQANWWVVLHDSSVAQVCYVGCYNSSASSYSYVSFRGVPVPGNQNECNINIYHKPYPTDMCGNENSWWGPVYICGFYNNNPTADTGFVRGYACNTGSNTAIIDYYGPLIQIIGGKAWGIKRYFYSITGSYYLFVASGKMGLRIYQILTENPNQNPNYNTTPAGSWAPVDETALDARDVYVGSDYFAFLANWGTTNSQPIVYALDISDFSNITKLAQANGTYGRKVWVDSDRWITLLSDQYLVPSSP